MTTHPRLRPVTIRTSDRMADIMRTADACAAELRRIERVLEDALAQSDAHGVNRYARLTGLLSEAIDTTEQVAYEASEAFSHHADLEVPEIRDAIDAACATFARPVPEAMRAQMRADESILQANVRVMRGLDDLLGFGDGAA